MSKNLPVVPEKQHATLGASTSGRWMTCPGSVRMSAGIPEASNETEYAREGTAAHALAELCLSRSVEPSTFVGMTIEGVEVTDEMAEYVSVFVDYCRALADATPQHWIEQKFSLAALNPPAPMFGTADFVAYSDGTLEVVDLKYGQGVVVQVRGNKQLRYYALGAALSLGGYDIDKVKITIVQPRVAHPDGVVRSETVDFAELIDFAGELLEAARATLDPDAPLATGDHCRFCPALAVCPLQREEAQALAQVEFSVMEAGDVPPAPSTLPLDVLVDILDKLPVLEDWAKAVRAHVQGLLEKGEAVPGYKLVQKRATRRWASEAQVKNWMIEHGYDPEEILNTELKSPAQIEKVMGKAKKELPAEFIVKKSSGYTLALDHDARPAVVLSPGSEFPALPAGNEEV